MKGKDGSGLGRRSLWGKEVAHFQQVSKKAVSPSHPGECQNRYFWNKNLKKQSDESLL